MLHRRLLVATWISLVTRRWAVIAILFGPDPHCFVAIN